MLSKIIDFYFMKKKILFAFCTNVAIGPLVRNSADPEQISAAYFESEDLWPKKANSTARLNLVNYQATWPLKNEFNIKYSCFVKVTPLLLSAFDEYDIVVVNQVASSTDFLIELVSYLRGRKIKAKVIFGTEYSWSQKVLAGEVPLETAVEVYTKHTLLRHTARTDGFIYSTDLYKNSNVKEFEIGLDCAVVRGEKSASERRYIAFAKGPEGRKIKNNEEIDLIIKKIRSSHILSKYEVKIMEPPYSTSEYWEVMRDSAFFILTSLGETFSYCLQDAKACGAIGFYPSDMFSNRIRNFIVAESYPWMGNKYVSIDGLIASIEEIAADSSKLDDFSVRASSEVQKEFSVEAISTKWRQLFRGESTHDRAMYIYGKDRNDETDVRNKCKALDIEFALPFLNQSEFSFLSERLTEFDAINSIVHLKYYLSVRQDKTYLGMGKLLDRTVFLKTPDREFKSTVEGATLFLHLLIRMYKISRVYLDKNLIGTECGKALDYLVANSIEVRGEKLEVVTL